MCSTCLAADDKIILRHDDLTSLWCKNILSLKFPNVASILKVNFEKKKKERHLMTQIFNIYTKITQLLDYNLAYSLFIAL